jgi:molybdenum cofactor biosynthesis protein B
MAQHPDHQAANQRLDNTLPENPLRTSSPSGSSRSTEQHRAEAPGRVRCFVLTVSDTRDAESDTSGYLIRDLLESSGHAITGSRIVRDDEFSIRDAVRTAIDGIADPECVIVTGGSGIGSRDVSPEALRPLLTKELPGFGEIFRMLSYGEIGGAAMLTRAFAGVVGRTLLFVLPGSTSAVKLAMQRLIGPELGHLVREVRPERRGE